MTNIVSLGTSTNTTPQTLILDMLQGVKVAGGEAYEASKASLGKAAAFAYEQAPLLVQEFLTWKVIDNLFIIGLIIFAIIGLCYLAKWVHNTPKITDNDPLAYIVGVILPIGVSIMLFFLAVSHVKDICKIKMAPRVYLIEWASEQIVKK